MEKFKQFILRHKAESIITILIVIVVMVLILFTAALGKENEIEEESTTTETVETTTVKVTETTTDPHEGLVQSFLTGEYVEESQASKRPLAVMINNIDKANPQSGIEAAGVIYEAPVEGALTRLMAIYEDYSNLEKIGSIRSSRLYYCYFALEFDAIYAHYGQSKYALSFLNSSSIDNVSGLSSGSSAYYRASGVSAPHNVFSTSEKMSAAIEKLGYSTTYDDDYEGKFTFAEDENSVVLDSDIIANTVYPGYSINKPYFEYNQETGMYSRYQYGSAHIDAVTGKQLTCKNIIIQCVSSSYYDDNKSLNITLTGSGSGYYITNGKAAEVTWKKDSELGITHYYDNSTGEEITLNIGKTWVCVVQNSLADNILISE